MRSPAEGGVEVECEICGSEVNEQPIRMVMAGKTQTDIPINFHPAAMPSR
jgi:hypothetical protein